MHFSSFLVTLCVFSVFCFLFCLVFNFNSSSSLSDMCYLHSIGRSAYVGLVVAVGSVQCFQFNNVCVFMYNCGPENDLPGRGFSSFL